MESPLFNDLRKALRDANQVWVPGDQTLKSLAQAVSKHSTKKQSKELLKEFPEIFASRGDKLVVKGQKKPIVNKPINKAVTKKTKGAERFVLGRFGTEVQAKAAGQQVMTPDALTYQSALFPNPKDYGVDVQVVDAKPVKVDNGSPLYPWGLSVALRIKGDTMRKAKWIGSFKEKIRAQV